jgi:fructokinase
VQRDDQRSTGTVKVTVDARGTPDFDIAPDVAFDYLEVTYELLELAGSADCFCFGTLAQRSPVARQTLHRLLDVAQKPVKFFDINLRRRAYTLETIRHSLQRADVLKLNQEEAHYLAGVFNQPLAYLPDFCAWLVTEWSLRACVVTLGEFGSYARLASGDQVHVPGFAVDVADTCGSGDAFSAAFMHGYLNDWKLADSCRLGNALGAMVATRTGATYPFLVAEVQQFLTAEHRLVPEPTLRGLVPRGP